MKLLSSDELAKSADAMSRAAMQIPEELKAIKAELIRQTSLLEMILQKLDRVDDPILPSEFSPASIEPHLKEKEDAQAIWGLVP
jgi:hypothetical protein